MQNDLRTKIQETFADVYTIPDLATLYAEIQLECQKQIYFIAEKIKREVIDDAERNER